MKKLGILLVLCAAALLSACGGGGGSPGTTTGSSSTANAIPATSTLTVALVNPSGAAVSSISTGGGFTARATLVDPAGAAIANKLVTFSLNGASIATLAPDTGLTNAAGVAVVNIAPTSISAVGAATLSASAAVGTSTVSGKADFAVSATNLSLSAIGLGSSNVSSGGNTAISVTALINSLPSTGLPVNVTFSASCGRFNGAGGSFSVTTNGSGVAAAAYTAVNADGSLCSGPVTLSAGSPGATARSATLTVASPVANAITFISATPPQIFVAGSGALEQSVVRFKVLSGTTPMVNEPVVFSVTINPGGVGLNAAGSLANVTATTDSQGEAIVQVFSGTIPGPVRVRATLAANTSVFAESQNLSVSSGPASQRFMSLSVQTFNIEGWNIDGSSTRLTARLADRQGNPVEDGTVVNFTAEGGQVASSCATAKVNGISSCSVDFISQNPRPTGGRASVLAFTSGTKDYVDVNGNNRFDAGTDTLINIGDAYRDDNEDGTFNAGEFTIPRGGASACAAAGAPFPSRADTCDTNLATTVRQQAVILFSSSSARVVVTSASVLAVSFNLASADNIKLPMPSGTTITVDAADGTPGNSLACSVDKIVPSTVPNVGPTTNPAADLTTNHTVFLLGCAAGDSVLIRVTSPSGLQTIFQQAL